MARRSGRPLRFLSAVHAKQLQLSVGGFLLFIGAILVFVAGRIWWGEADHRGFEFTVFTLYSGALAWYLFRGGRAAARLADGSGRLIERMPGGVALVGRTGRVQKVNPSFCALFGLKEVDLQGKSLQEVPALAPLADLSARLSRRGGDATWLERLRMEGPGAEPFDVFAGAVTLDPDDPGGAHFLFVNDATEAVRLRLEARRHQNVSEYLLDAVTHELSNSMQVVQGMSELASDTSCRILCRGQVPCSKAANAARRASDMLKDVKLVALAEREDFPPTPARLAEFLEAALRAAQLPPDVVPLLRVPSQVIRARIAASPLVALGMKKLIGEAGLRARSARRPLSVEVRAREGRGPWGSVEVTIGHAAADGLALSDGVELGRPARTGAPDIMRRSPLPLALASTAFDRAGWSLRTSGGPGGGHGSVFEVVIPLIACETPPAPPGPSRAVLESPAPA